MSGKSRAIHLAKKALVFSLTQRFPSASNIGDPTIEAYAEDLEPFDLEVVKTAVERYRAGEVPGQNLTFPPSSPELVKQCRMFQQIEDRKRIEPEKLVSYPIGELPPPNHHAAGITEVDFGQGRIDMTKLTQGEAEEVMRTRQRPQKAGIRPQLKTVESEK